VLGCEAFPSSIRFKQVNHLACDAGCEAADEIYPTVIQGFVRQQGRSTLVDNWLSAKLIYSDLRIPVIAEIVEGNVVVEWDKVSFRPGTSVSAITASGKQMTGTTVSTAAIALRTSIEAFIDVAVEEKQASLGGMLLLAVGSYRKGEGIVIGKGIKATILVGTKAYTGSTSEEIRVAQNKFETAADTTSPTQTITQKEATLTFVDNSLSAKIMYSDASLPVAAEIIEGEVMVEMDKISFWPDTSVSAITASGKRVSGTTVATAAIALSTSIAAIIDVASEEKQTSIGGMLLLAEGSYKENEGILIRKGTKATILVGAKTHSGNIAEDTRIELKMLQTEILRPGLRRLTQ